MKLLKDAASTFGIAPMLSQKVRETMREEYRTESKATQGKTGSRPNFHGHAGGEEQVKVRVASCQLCHKHEMTTCYISCHLLQAVESQS